MNKENDTLKLFKVESGIIYKWNDKSAYYEFVAKNIWIKERLQAIDDGTWYLTIGYKDPNGDTKDFTIAQEQIKRNELLNYMGIGIDITEGNAKDVRAFLNYSLRNFDIPVRNVHKSLGWLYDKDNVRTKTFLLDKAIGGTIESTYIGTVNIKPRGKATEFKRFVIDELEDSPCLQLALVLGLTAPVLSVVADEKDLENMFLNLSGDSSRGKSTALTLAMSCWGKSSVSDGRGSLIQSWSSTENAMFKSFSQQKLNGFPICRDECGANNIRNFNSFVYKFCMGVEKNRMNKDCVLQKVETFRTVMLSSGEVRIQDLMKEHTLGSSVVRLTEFNNLPWTKDAEQADRIKRFTSRHYGTLGKEFVELLCEYTEDEIFDIWYDYTDKLKPMLEPYVRHFASRIASKYAIFMTTFFILTGLLDVEWNEDVIMEILVDSAKDKEDEIKLAKNAYDLIMDFVSENSSHFYSYKGSSYSHNSKIEKNYSTTIFGKYNEDGDVTISRKQFNRLLIGNGFKNPKLVLMQLKEKGALIVEHDGERNNFYNRRTVGTSDKIPVVVIKKNVVFDDEDIVGSDDVKNEEELVDNEKMFEEE